MGLFKRTNEMAYFRAAYTNYESYESQGLDTETVIVKLITESPQSGRKPLLGFNNHTLSRFSLYFTNISHKQAKTAICNMIVFGVRQKVNISDFNDETMNQFIEQALEQSSS